MKNVFADDLAWSHAQSDQPWWETVYRSAFPTFVSMHDVRKDGWAQRGGIDRQVFLDDGTVLKIDEKVRRTVYDDILLEAFSDWDRQTPGWLDKGLTCDFIAYAFLPTQTCYLLPFQTLRTAWVAKRSEWWIKHRRVPAKNERYTTMSVAVPVAELMAAMQDAMTVCWQPKVAA